MPQTLVFVLRTRYNEEVNKGDTPMTFYLQNQESGTSYTFTIEELRQLLKASGMSADEFADYATGFNCDSYADAAEELARAYDGDCERASEDYPSAYETCRTYHRILNLSTDLTCEQVQQAWEEDFRATAED